MSDFQIRIYRFLRKRGVRAIKAIQIARSTTPPTPFVEDFPIENFPMLQ